MEQKKPNKALWITILVISLLVILGCGGFLIYYFFGQHPINRNDFTDAPSATASETTAQTETVTELPTEKETHTTYGYQMETTPDVKDLSFDEMMELNSDIYAWIYVPNTNIDYPVAQCNSTRDDSFYLNHNIYKEYEFSGTIYSEIQNSTEFDDPVTVLYGHNMLNGSMFATLLKFMDKDFFDDNNTIFIFTKDRILTYLIYSAYVYDDRHILNSFRMDDEGSLQKYLNSTLKPRSYNKNVRKGVTVTTEDNILTLSTCTSAAGDARYLVQGVLVDDQPRE